MSAAFQRAAQANPFMRPVAVAQTEATFNLVAGFIYAQTVSALVSLKALEALADGPRPTADLAAAFNMPARSVEVLMSAAHAIGLVDRRIGGWGLGLKGAAILGQGGIAEMVTHHRHLYGDLADPVALLRGEAEPTALSAFWTYTEGAPEEADAAPYSALMAASQAFIAHAVLHNRVFGETRALLDLGGGAGAFALEALRCHAKLTVTVADRADVVPLAEAAFKAAKMDARASTQPVDFFQDRLAFDADTISLVRILHDHDDGPVRQLLASLATGSPHARLLVIEPMATPRRPTGVDAYFPWYFMAMGQGKLRSERTLRQLLQEAGYGRITRLRTRNPTMVRGLLAQV